MKSSSFPFRPPRFQSRSSRFERLEFSCYQLFSVLPCCSSGTQTQPKKRNRALLDYWGQNPNPTKKRNGHKGNARLGAPSLRMPRTQRKPAESRANRSAPGRTPPAPWSSRAPPFVLLLPFLVCRFSLFVFFLPPDRKLSVFRFSFLFLPLLFPMFPRIGSCRFCCFFVFASSFFGGSSCFVCLFLSFLRVGRSGGNKEPTHR